MKGISDELGETFFGRDAVVHAEHRRGFLQRIGTIGALGALGAVVIGARPLGAADAAPPSAPTADDVSLLAWAQSLELAAVAAYGIAIDSKKLDAATGAVAALFQDHHRQHAAAMGALAGKQSVGTANQAVVDAVAPSFTKASSAREVLKAAYDLENIAAATYLSALGVLTGTNGAAAVASIQPIEARHATVLGQVLELNVGELVGAFDLYDRKALDPAKFPIAGK